MNINKEGMAMKTLESALTKEEANFVRLVFARQGAKLNSGEASHWSEEREENVSLWENPEKLGLIKCVGSYKWIPTDKLGLCICILE